MLQTIPFAIFKFVRGKGFESFDTNIRGEELRVFWLILLKYEFICDMCIV